MMNIIKCFVSCILLTLSVSSLASTERNDVPSCSHSISSEYYQLPNQRELFILVDKTMAHSFSQDSRKAIYDSVIRFIQPGDKVKFIEFSSFARDSFTKVDFNGQLDIPLQENVRDEIKKSALRSFDTCLLKQRNYMYGKLGQLFKVAFEAQDQQTNTELMGTLVDIGNQAIVSSKVERKVVVLLSDMLENSDITSFYSHNHTRIIEPLVELQKVEKANMFANFNNADIYIIGTGMTANNQYVSAQKMAQLETFWRDYFKHSNSKIIGFGKPMLLGDIQ